MIKNVRLEVGDNYEWIINADTNEVITEGHRLSAEDILFALGYRFDIVERGVED